MTGFPPNLMCSFRICRKKYFLREIINYDIVHSTIRKTVLGVVSYFCGSKLVFLGVKKDYLGAQLVYLGVLVDYLGVKKFIWG